MQRGAGVHVGLNAPRLDATHWRWDLLAGGWKAKKHEPHEYQVVGAHWDRDQLQRPAGTIRVETLD